VSQYKAKSDNFQRVGDCFYGYTPNGKYYALIKHEGRVFKKSLKTDSLPVAKRRLRDERDSVERIDVGAG
jgi:hypothetical protein